MAELSSLSSLSRFALANASSSIRSSKVTAPQLILTVTQDKVKINEQASILLGIANGDNLAFVNNAQEITKAVSDGILEGTENPNEFIDLETNEVIKVFWGITKGYPKLDSKGLPVMTRDRVTHNDVPAFVGCKMSNVTGAIGVGMNLEGSDSKNYRMLQGSTASNMIYDILAKDKMTVTIDGEERCVYPIEFSTEIAKIPREKKKITNTVINEFDDTSISSKVNSKTNKSNKGSKRR